MSDTHSDFPEFEFHAQDYRKLLKTLQIRPSRTVMRLTGRKKGIYASLGGNVKTYKDYHKKLSNIVHHENYPISIIITAGLTAILSASAGLGVGESAGFLMGLGSFLSTAAATGSVPFTLAYDAIFHSNLPGPENAMTAITEVNNDMIKVLQQTDGFKIFTQNWLLSKHNKGPWADYQTDIIKAAAWSLMFSMETLELSEKLQRKLGQGKKFDATLIEELKTELKDAWGDAFNVNTIEAMRQAAQEKLAEEKKKEDKTRLEQKKSDKNNNRLTP